MNKQYCNVILIYYLQYCRYHNMSKTIIFYTLLLFCIQCGVVELTEETFQELTTNNNYAFVYFYSPTCKYCKILQPDFKKLSEEEDFDSLNIKFGKIDATKYEALSQKYQVQSYPSLFFFDHSFILNYQEERSYSHMEKWIRNYLMDRVIIINKEQLDSKKKPYIIIQGGSPNENKVLNQSIYGIDDVVAYNIGEGERSIKIITKKGEFEYKNEIERIKLRSWILHHVSNSIIPLNDEKNIKKYIREASKPSLVFVLVSDDRQNQEIYDTLMELCQQNKGKLYCLQILEEYKSYQGVHGYFQVQNTKSSIIGLVKEKMNIAYRMDIPFQSITRTNLNSFIEGSINDTLNRIVDNVAPPSVQFNLVKVLTSQTFNQTLSNNKYVFINFYKSDDEGSLIFSRTFEKFATLTHHDSSFHNLIVAAIDCSKNKDLCIQNEITYYPTLLLYIDNAYIEYEKTQKLPEVQHLTKFVASKKNKNIQPLSNTEELLHIVKPAIVIVGEEMTNQIRIFSAEFGQIKCYFLKNQSKKPRIYLYLGDEIMQYNGQSKANKVKKWVNQIAESLLSDLMRQNQDKRIAQAVKNKKPIIILLDVDKNKSTKFKLNLGYICKRLKICGAYANSDNPSFDSLRVWVGIQKPQQSKLIYSDVKTDVKYLYKHSLDEVNEASVQTFVANIQAGKIKSIAEENKKQINNQRIESQDYTNEETYMIIQSTLKQKEILCSNKAY